MTTYRGLPLVRYADDFAIFAKSKRAADRTLASISRYLTETLRPRLIGCPAGESISF